MGESGQFSLSKKERLCDFRLIETLYQGSSSIKAFPVIFTFRVSQMDLPLGYQFMFTVSKRSFKKAVDRNRIKRLLREAFRLQKTEFIKNHSGTPLIGSFIYTGKHLPELKELEKSLLKIRIKLNEKPIV